MFASPSPPLRGLACAIALGLVTARGAAQDLPSGDPVPVELPAPVTPGLRGAAIEHELPGVLVLIGGRLVEGQISETAGGYLVELPRGRFVVPRERVLLTARDREHAYEKQRESMRPPSPSNHYELARWCLRHGMLEEGKTELRSALRLAATYAPARQLLKDVEEMERPNDPRHARSESAARVTEDGFAVPEPTSLAGLSADSVRIFTSQVHLLLVNGCGNARCHGGSTDNGFHLERVNFSQAGNRTLVHRNLVAAIGQIDPRHAAASPLLAKPSGPHGTAPRSTFDVPGGREQRELLRAWVIAVAGELAEDRGLERTGDLATSLPVGGTERFAPQVSRPPTFAGHASDPRAPDLLDRILDDERPDAFDPQAFNRGTAGRPPRGQR